MPTFCRHGRFLQNCRICNAKEPAAGGAGSRGAATTASRPASKPASSRTSSRGRGASGLVVRRQARAVEDGYANEHVPGLKASADARRLADEIAFSTARLAELAADPPGLYAEAALADDREEGLWLAFLIAHLCPTAGGAASVPGRGAVGAGAGSAAVGGTASGAGGGEEDPFAQIARARTTWASGEPPALGEGVVLGPRTSVDPRQPTRTAEAYRAWAARAGSQQAAIAGDASWTPERRFSRLFERLALPGFTRAGRVELLISLGRLGLAEVDPAELRLGDPNDDTTIAAKRAFGIGDAFMLERRVADLAEAAEVPLAAMDLALFNFGQPEDARATMGSRAEPDPALRERIERTLGLA